VSFRNIMDAIRTWCTHVLRCVNSVPASSASKDAEISSGAPDRGVRLLDPGEGLLRRAWRSGKWGRTVIDQITGIARAPAAAFEPRLPDPKKPDKKVDEALSINVESSLRAAGLPLTWGADLNQYVARITVGDCLANDLEAYRHPLPENPHHGLIWGLVEMASRDPDRYERTLNALARTSTIIPDEPVLAGN
jgi:hypothetical protein